MFKKMAFLNKDNEKEKHKYNKQFNQRPLLTEYWNNMRRNLMQEDKDY